MRGTSGARRAFAARMLATGVALGMVSCMALPGGTVRVQGELQLPAELISNNGAKIVSPNGGSIVSPNGSGLVSTNGSGYRIASIASQAVPGVDLLGLQWARAGWSLPPAGTRWTGNTDSSGAFTITGLQPGNLYLIEATGSLHLTPESLVSLDQANLAPDPSQAGSWSAYTQTSWVLKTPVVVSVGSTVMSAGLQSVIASGDLSPLGLDQQGITAMDMAADQALTQPDVDALASGSDPATVFQQLVTDPRVASALQGAGVVLPPVVPTPVPTSTPIGGNVNGT